VTLPFKVSRKEQYSFFVYRGQKDLAQMPFTLRCDQCIVKSVLQDQLLYTSQESVVDKERPGRHQNNAAARSFLIHNTCRSKYPVMSNTWYSVIRFPWAKASAYAIIHPELCPVHSDKCFTKPAIHAWYNKFTNSQESVMNNERSGRSVVLMAATRYGNKNILADWKMELSPHFQRRKT